VTPRRERAAPRWQDPELDEAALDVARRIREAVPLLRGRQAPRWADWLEPLVPAFEDGDREALQAAAAGARAAFGVQDSVRDVWVEDDAVALRDAIDRLRRLLAARAAMGS